MKLYPELTQDTQGVAQARHPHAENQRYTDEDNLSWYNLLEQLQLVPKKPTARHLHYVKERRNSSNWENFLRGYRQHIDEDSRGGDFFLTGSLATGGALIIALMSSPPPISLVLGLGAVLMWAIVSITALFIDLFIPPTIAGIKQMLFPHSKKSGKSTRPSKKNNNNSAALIIQKLLHAAQKENAGTSNDVTAASWSPENHELGSLQHKLLNNESPQHIDAALKALSKLEKLNLPSETSSPSLFNAPKKLRLNLLMQLKDHSNIHHHYTKNEKKLVLEHLVDQLNQLGTQEEVLDYYDKHSNAAYLSQHRHTGLQKLRTLFFSDHYKLNTNSQNKLRAAVADRFSELGDRKSEVGEENQPFDGRNNASTQTHMEFAELGLKAKFMPRAPGL